MRTYRLRAATVALTLVALLASPVTGAPDDALRFARVPDPGPSVGGADHARERQREPDVRLVVQSVSAPAAQPPAGSRPMVAVTPQATKRPMVVGRRAVVNGIASWFCGHGSRCTRGHPGGLFAAAGPALRVGDWRGRTVLVRAGGRSVSVVLIDWCACPRRTLDLYHDAFSRLADPSRGLLNVTVTW